MNTAAEVKSYIAAEKAKGADLQALTWIAAKMCVGWPYVFGASGQECTPAYRRQAYARKGDEHPTIKTKCKGFSDNNCAGCQWYPGGKRVLCFDCRGFTYDLLYLVYGWKLQGSGCTSQWNNAENWKAKGKVSDGIPKDTLVCLFYSKNNREVTWQHTGFGLNGETVECSAGVQYNKTTDKKWTHWAVPKCVSGDVPTPTPVPTPEPEKGYAIVTGKNLALRQGPGTNKAVITRIPTGKTVKLLEDPEDWQYVEYNGKTGFVMKKYIREG